ncbi:aminopeptidase P1-like isoform X1 [Coffea arabica]|uniref:Aminopeptidase P1-like isoform X1 n=1 Tax=Coffea arabica TaxID=13443 RepID=A0ABM4V1S5_COFAR|nr:aminopeptidase P1 isoform X3 [Coffea arabica]
MAEEDKLASLRSLMASHSPPLHALVVPSEDYHQSEYVSARDKRRAFISGFTGSAGLALVTMEEARLWTDGRYFLQAAQELNDQWKLMRMGEDPPVDIWMADNLPKDAAIGVDPWCVSVDTAQKWERAFSKKQQKLIQTPRNLVDEVWISRPPLELNPVAVHPPQFSGRSVADKLKDLRENLVQEKARGILITTLDEVAWLYNIRGTDVSYCPVVHAFAVVTLYSAFLYVDQRKLSSENPVEMDGLKKAHIRDGAAVVQYLVWLDKQMQELYGASGYFLEVENIKKDVNTIRLTEVSASDKLEQFRASKEHFRGLSFPTISSVGPNAAIIHYSPDAKSCADLDPNSIYLFDSGAQYLDGTTDITRTVHFGKPTKHEKACYTAVLKGHIALGNAQFPSGTNGNTLDVLARIPLWKYGLDYRHGTGHGIGSYLNVHEGPHQISFRPAARNVPLQASMTVTDEPGYYEDGNFGIRLENVLIIKEADTEFNFDDKGYLTFEHITWAPYQTKLIDFSLLVPEEIEWLNNYHSKCSDILAPYLDESEKAWLKKATQPVCVC